MNKIVCLSTSTWYPFPTRKQHVMQRLSNAEILYFDPPITYLAPIKDRKTWKRLFAWMKKPAEPKENIKVFSCPPVLPFYNKFRFLNKWNQKKIARFVRRRMKRYGFESPVLWCYSPMSADAVDHIPHSALVYDCVDRHSAYKGLIDVDTVNGMEKTLAEKANQVIATAIGLYDTLETYNPNTVMLPNGVNFDHFHRAVLEDTPVPEDLKNLPRPIIGFSGMLQECIDYEAIEAVAKSHPEWSVVLVGGPMPGVNLDYLKEYPNIYFLGMKKYDEMPAYLRGFDVCMNAFRAGRLSKDVSPLKFFEYMASGRPIVSTPQPEQVLGYTDAVYISHSAQDFVDKCELALHEVGPAKEELRIAYARACSWDARVREMEDLLKKRGVFTE
ncbi:MAG: glycosyltransferase [Oscillospiraceae bacterium]|nr:glycosyltransferase [Oscillospiraceae bacterium]